MPQAADNPGSGILLFDPNPTTSKAAVAILRREGFTVYEVTTPGQAVALCRSQALGLDAIVVDAVASPARATSMLKALVALPQMADLPGVLIVSENNPAPIPGASALPTLTRPFAPQALVELLHATLQTPKTRAEVVPFSDEVLARLEIAVTEHLGRVRCDRESLVRFASALVNDPHLPAAGATVAMSAELSMIPFDSVLAMLAESSVRGIVTITRGRAIAKLHIEQGLLRMAEAREVEEDLRLGRFVVEAGLVTNEALEEFIQRPGNLRLPLGARLLNAGLLREGELVDVLVLQATEVACHVLAWDHGHVSFSATGQLVPLAAHVARARADLSLSQVLLEGLRRLDEANHMGPHMPNLDETYVRVDEQLTKLGRHALVRDELAVLELLNGRNTLKDVARRTRIGAFGVSKIVHRLSRSGLARPRTMAVR